MTETTEEIIIKSRRVGKAQELIEHLEGQITSLTKERDELKHDIDRHIKICSGQLHEIEDLDSQAKDHSHKVSTLIKIKNELQTKLSNREKEIEELKKDKNSILQLFNDPDYFYDPNDTDSNECIRIEDFNEKLKDYDEGEVLKLIPVHELLPRYFVVGDHDQYFKTEHEALASLNKEREE